jgi:hypothetical protein
MLRWYSLTKFGEIKRWWLLHQKIIVIIKVADPEVMFIEKIWNDPNNIHLSKVPAAAAGLGLHQ